MPTKTIRFLAVGAATLILVAGCAGPPPESPGPPAVARASANPGSPRPSLSSLAATAVVSAPEHLGLDATVERDRVGVTITLDRNPMPAGEPTWISTTIRNASREPLFWDADCDAAVWVNGELAGPPWRSGAVQPEPFRTWKAYLLGGVAAAGADRMVAFQPKSLVDRGAGACSEIGHTHVIAPGETLEQRARWDGRAFDRLAPPPPGPVELVARFDYGRTEDGPRASAIDVHLAAAIGGPAERLLDPAEAVDVALTVPRLTALLGSRQLGNGNSGLCRFNPSSGAYEIGMVESGSLPVSRLHLVVVNARTAVVGAFVDRDWNDEVDGAP